MPKFGDTPNFSRESLCSTCRNGHTIKGRGLSEELVLCRAGNGMDPIRIPRPVVECSEYDDKRTPSLWQMEKVAWRFSVDNKKKTMGFLNANDWRNKLKSEGKEEEDLPTPF